MKLVREKIENVEEKVVREWNGRTGGNNCDC